MAVFLLSQGHSSSDVNYFLSEWGVDKAYTGRGGLVKTKPAQPKREIHLLQRKKTKPGAGLGKTTGWIHRSVLKRNGVKYWNGVEYLGITDEGLGIDHNGMTQLLAVDTIVVCAGQESERGLVDLLEKDGVNYHVIGGALEAGELDAQRAIEQGVSVADSL